MRIGILGDTHGDSFSIRLAVEAVKNADLWLHTGDFCRDAMLVAALAATPVTTVGGNCDGRAKAKPDEFIEACGYRLWLTHGHRHDVKYGLADLENWAVRYGVDVAIFGHTHQSYCETVNGILYFNPGSASEPRRGKPRSCGLLELLPDRGGLHSQLICI